MAFAFAGFAAFGALVFLAFFGRHMRGRFNTLFAQTLVLDLLLMLDHSLFLFALEGFYLFGRQLLVAKEVFVDKECGPSVRARIACLLGREMGVLPVRQLLGLGYLLAETDGEDLLQPEVEYAVLGHDLLDVHAVSGGEITPAAQAVDIIFEGQADFLDVGVGKEGSEALGKADMREAEEVTTLVRGDLNEGRRVVNPALKTRAGFGVHSDRFLRTQIGDGFLYHLGLIDDDHFAVEGR